MKTPKLKFYGIECTIQELQTLRMAARYNNTDIGFEHHDLKPCVQLGPVFAEGSMFAKQYSDTIPSLVAKGVLYHEKRKDIYGFTPIGTQYLFKVARHNKHLRFFKSWKYEERQAKRAASRVRKIV